MGSTCAACGADRMFPATVRATLSGPASGRSAEAFVRELFRKCCAPQHPAPGDPLDATVAEVRVRVCAARDPPPPVYVPEFECVSLAVVATTHSR